MPSKKRAPPGVDAAEERRPATSRSRTAVCSRQLWSLAATAVAALAAVVWRGALSVPDLRMGDAHPLRRWIAELQEGGFVVTQERSLELQNWLRRTWHGTVIAGWIHWPNSKWNAQFSILPSLISRDEAEAMKQILLEVPDDFDEDRDGVDEMITYEFIISSAGAKKATDPPREPLRQRLRDITVPILRDRIEPFVRQRYPQARRVCHSMIRRYLHRERRTHGTHWDVPSFVSVVVSLDSSGTDFQGGFYVTTGTGLNSFIPLQLGDAIVHQGDLMHGVHVLEGDRWSWAMWFQDTDDCSSEPSHWWKEEAASGDPVAQTLRAMRSRDAAETLSLIRSAAASGFQRALVYLGKSYQEGWPGQTKDFAEARRCYGAALAAGDVEACVHLGRLELDRGNATGAWRLYELGAKQGDPSAMEALAALHLAPPVELDGSDSQPKDLDAATRWFSKAADFKVDAMYEAARLYALATPTRPADGAAAALHLERAARMGHLQAMRELVEPLLKQRRFQEAVPWLLRLESGPPIETFLQLYEAGEPMSDRALFRAAQVIQGFMAEGHKEARVFLDRLEAAWHRNHAQQQ